MSIANVHYKGASKIIQRICNAVNALIEKQEHFSEDLEEKQNKLTFDSTPTPGSKNPVTSEGIAAAIPKSNAGRDLLWKGSIAAPVAMTTVSLKVSLENYDAIGFYATFTNDRFGGYIECPLSIIRDQPKQIIVSAIFQNFAPALQYGSETTIKVGSSASDAIVTFKEIYGIR